jgi:hypothetical protein
MKCIVALALLSGAQAFAPAQTVRHGAMQLHAVAEGEMTKASVKEVAMRGAKPTSDEAISSARGKFSAASRPLRLRRRGTVLEAIAGKQWGSRLDARRGCPCLYCRRARR